MSKWIVGCKDLQLEDDDIAVIEAPTQIKAVDIFIANSVFRDSFQEYISERAVNMCYAEKFWLSDDGDEVIVSEPIFRLKVKRFFTPRHASWAKLYLAAWSATPGDRWMKTDPFPLKMLVWMWKKGDYSNPIAIPLEDDVETGVQFRRRTK